MPYYTKEQIQQARQVDLLTYLQRHDPGELVHVSGGTYCTKTHDSLKISNGKWCWWSRNIGGSTPWIIWSKCVAANCRRRLE